MVRQQIREEIFVFNTKVGSLSAFKQNKESCFIYHTCPSDEVSAVIILSFVSRENFSVCMSYLIKFLSIKKYRLSKLSPTINETSLPNQTGGSSPTDFIQPLNILTRFPSYWLIPSFVPNHILPNLS